MAEALLLDRWGYLILAALVIGEQVGIPLPAVPALLGVGSLAAVAGSRRNPAFCFGTRLCGGHSQPLGNTILGGGTEVE